MRKKIIIVSIALLTMYAFQKIPHEQRAILRDFLIKVAIKILSKN